MFKIIELQIYSPSNECFTYEFKTGINYFKGGNSTGKTEFYKFIDFMLGSSEDMSKKVWYKGSFKKALMIFEYKKIKYSVVRTLDKEKNYFYYQKDSFDEKDYINLKEYKEKLNAVFANDDILKELKQFTNEHLTFRTFTMFNFLGEKGQGLTYNFLDKCRDVKYYTKLSSVLNYIFNKNIEKIFLLQDQIKILQKDIAKLKEKDSKYSFIKSQVNNNLKKLSSTRIYNGKNTSEVLEFIKEYKQLNVDKKPIKSKVISELEASYSELDEQIKIYENRKHDSKEMLKEYENRKEMLQVLNELLNDNKELTYLTKPLTELLEEMDDAISFSKYLIKDEAILKLKDKRENLKKQLQDNESRFQVFSVDEKIKAIMLIEEYLSDDVYDVDKELQIKAKKMKSLKENLKNLQDADDTKKTDQFSEYITELYKSAYGVSEIVNTDINEKGFRIEYIKRGNVLQSRKRLKNKDKLDEVNYVMGSMARHTLVQLCGYLAFIKLLICEERTPTIPILVLDHISKPFDKENISSIGTIISKFYEDVSKKDVQIFIFDDKKYEELGLNVDKFDELNNENKTGFNPFYKGKESNK
ncbi:hypothetical protein P4U03_20040 [Bacillus mycoides]|uniref:Rad50/SbcC-type AAA domain-containing protein n=1 Tax=Bacillus thuringiensis serovar navarrensis TaxID=339658 RepID=A0A243AC33_BACTU|nr:MULTISPECIES: hypothetical protein [Bacillus cereus group]MED1268840.1 hypothetical protein [Bacillus mycoides]OTY16378.1 hypothetical protein BK732_15140 [Bacillus thuringiensis serovar navarrensis]